MDVKTGVVKTVPAWFGYWFSTIGIDTWSEAAGFAATLYSLCLLGDWLYKKVKAYLDSRKEK